MKDLIPCDVVRSPDVNECKRRRKGEMDEMRSTQIYVMVPQSISVHNGRCLLISEMPSVESQNRLAYRNEHGGGCHARVDGPPSLPSLPSMAW